MAADSGMDTCPSPENADSRKRPLDGDNENGDTKRSHFSSGDSKDLKVTKKVQENERHASDKLIDEANQKLKEALRNNNLQEAKIAQGILDGVKAMRLRPEELHKEKTVVLRKK
ncbi:hypothetical protein FQA39_LY02679 [Lamprigera yunnana]|nr:hypothetical protein FQA39_LY02679 [Lamprigera yunnana]